MLRPYFNETKRVDAGMILSVNRSIEQFCLQLRHYFRNRSKVPRKFIRLEMTASSFITALNELEQSKYACEQYAKMITELYENSMNEAERDDYYRYLYFYKNSFIRIFSVLDKLGYFMNDFFKLETSKVKARFSYFTVLRRMYEVRAHPQLQKHLYELKIKYETPMDQLRKKRNYEIHSINMEIINDLEELTTKHFEDRNKLEPVEENLAVLHQGYEMVCSSLYAVFTYCQKQVDKGHF